MSDTDETMNQPDERPREGMFDAQLSFSAPFIEAPLPVSRIVKRDGREVAFDKRKIADAIFAAATSIGGDDRDRADSLASGVTIYLTKMLNGATPTVDQVSDAVEKVLIQMGHAQTALAYARYRDKRVRMQKLREGDVRSILSELDEARRIGMEASGTMPRELFVRTSDDQIIEWDSARITEALVRETRMDPGLANLVAREVEQQIVSAGVKSLTASLVRELVDVRLMEHGLDEFRRRHMRLGVPLFDAERIICTPNQGETEWSQDPETSDHVLAERVKREFALSQVFTDDVAEAHLDGGIHLHDLGMPDRIDSLTVSAEYVLRWGIPPSGSRGSVRPPADIEMLLTQLGRLNAQLRSHVSGGLRWDALNVYLAPFLADFEEGLLRQFAKLLLVELAHGGASRGRRVPNAEIMLHWETPAHLLDAEAVGPGGVKMGSTCGAWITSAQRLANAFLDVCRDLPPGLSPMPCIVVTEAALHAPGFNQFLKRAAEVAAKRPVQYSLMRGELVEGPSDVPWTPREVIAHRVTLDLPRAAYCSDTVGALMSEIERLAALAIRAHADKRDFLERLVAQRNAGPLGLFTTEQEEVPFIDIRATTFAVGVVGLNECVQHMTGGELHNSDEALALAHRIVAHLDTVCLDLGDRQGLVISPAQTADLPTLIRFAQHDLQRYPDAARAVLKTDPFTRDLEYTPGTQLARRADNSPMERARIEGGFHDRVPLSAVTVVPLPAAETSHEAVAGFITKAFYRSRAQRISLVR